MKKYRGITKDGMLVYGDKIEVGNTCWIVSRPEVSENDDMREKYHSIWGFVEVIPETVGQKVGRKDKNSREIYAGLNNDGDNRGGDEVRQLGAEGELRWDDYLFQYVIQMDVRSSPFDPGDFDTEIIGDFLKRSRNEKD